MIGQEAQGNGDVDAIAVSGLAFITWPRRTVWGKGTAAQLPAMKGRWLRVDERRHDVLVSIARVFFLSLVGVKITSASPLGFMRVVPLDVTFDGGAEVVMRWIVLSFHRPASCWSSCFFSTFKHYIRMGSAHLISTNRSLVTYCFKNCWDSASR